MRVGVQHHLVRGPTFDAAKHRQTVTTEHWRAHRRGLFHLQAAPVDVHVLKRWRVQAAEHPQHLGLHALARIDELCRSVRGACHTAHQMLADPGPNAKSEHACGGGIMRAQINDLGLVRYLAIRQYEELPRALRVWRHLQEVLERRQNLSTTQVRPDLLDILRRLLQARLAIRSWGRPQGGKVASRNTRY